MSTAAPSQADALQLAEQYSREFLASLDPRPAAPAADLATLRSRLARPLADQGVAPEQIISELVRDTRDGFLASTGGRFFGWVKGGALPAALAADWLTTAWDQNAGLFATSPASAVAEEIAGDWLKEILGLPATASFALVTGCQMAHVTCLLAARHAVLERAGWDVEQRGLFGAPQIRILTSAHRHGSFERAARFTGLGLQQIETLPADESDRLRPAELAQALAAKPSAPTLVVLQAGEINLGAMDPFEELIAIAHKHNAWVHVDGAFGLWCAASPKYLHFTQGVQHADSWATDGHKWLNVPFDCGYAFVAHPAPHRAALGHRADYLTHTSGARDPLDWTPEWSRRARAFPTYAAIRQLGRAGIAALIERCCEHAKALARGIGALPGAEMLWEPTINQGLVRFLDPRVGANDEDHNRRTDRVILAVQAGREAFFTGTTWRGKRAMRISVCNWRTNEEDVRRSIAAVAETMHSN